ncbi:MAG: family 1 glycosylhydrolase, partial [Selenomonas sp.]|nr:family 1 glycosylhydrolase [Selenomonas sp.]
MSYHFIDKVELDGVRFYNAVIDEFLKQGIRPILNLHHFDLPVELYEKY